jgi:hypothetical protein
MLVHNRTVRWPGPLAKVEKEARFGRLVLAAPLVSVAQLLLLLVGRVISWRGLRRVAGVVWIRMALPLLLSLLLWVF